MCRRKSAVAARTPAPHTQTVARRRGGVLGVPKRPPPQPQAPRCLRNLFRCGGLVGGGMEKRLMRNFFGKSKKNTKERKWNPKGVPLVCLFCYKTKAAPTHVEILPLSGAPFVLFVCVLSCVRFCSTKKSSARA